MLEPTAAVKMTIDDEFGLFELAGWSPPQLDEILVRSGLPVAPSPGEALSAGERQVLRITPRTAWVVTQPGDIPSWEPADAGVAVDLSSSRMRLRLRGPVTRLLAALVAVDFAAASPTRFCASMIHGIPVTILRAPNGVDILVPRSFSATLTDWIEDAMQGCGAAGA